MNTRKLRIQGPGTALVLPGIMGIMTGTLSGGNVGLALFLPNAGATGSALYGLITTLGPPIQVRISTRR
ncbi:MAG: hypothetical protein GDA36_05120 [Rhodobacteraceae bacterium]|nr:hypothetical protein [Paracoccaceae bacterium]